MSTVVVPRRRRLTAPKIAPYLFILPNMLVFSIFTIWPAVSGFNLSFFDSSDGLKFKSVGTGNYKEILSDSEFWDAARATAIYTVGFVLISAVLATALGLLLNAQRRGRGAISAAYFLPVLISPVVVGVIWQAALDRNTGLVNQALSSVGLGHPGWLINSKLALVAVIFVGTWIHLGFYTMIILSGLQGIDTSVYEAAKLDGANAVVIGRSNLVGMPVALMLIKANATVTLCHSRTRDIADVVRRADVVIAAIGKPQFVKADWLKPGAVVIDVGTNQIPDANDPRGYRWVGDVDYDAALEVAGAISKVPGGVGPMTITMLLSNTMKAAWRLAEETSAER